MPVTSPTARRPYVQQAFPFAEDPYYRPDTPPELTDTTTVYLDCETTGLRAYAGDRPVGIAVKIPQQCSCYLPFGHRGGQNLDEATVKRWAQRELRGKRIINLNTRFDVNMLRGWGVDLAEQGCTFHDVAHSAALLDDHRRRFSLEALAQDVLGHGKLDAGDPQTIADMPASAIAAYAKRDVDLVADLFEAYAPQIAAQDLGRVAALEDAVIPVVAEMEWNGCRIDEARLHAWITQSEALVHALQWALTRAVGFPVNPDKTSDLVRMFTRLGLENPHTTEQGAPSFTGAFLRGIAHPDVQTLVKLGKLLDLRSKFLIPYARLAHAGRLHGSFHQLRSDVGGTVSGRFSSSQPNLQQVMTPRKQRVDYGEFEGETFIIKELFLPEPGQQWVSADAEQIEFRFAAHYAKAAPVLDAYAADPRTDFHTVVRDMIRTQQPDFDRDPAKNTNFAIIYGAGARKTAEMIGCDLSAAYDILHLHRAAFPELHELRDRAEMTANERGDVRTILGRRARFPNGERSYKALNAVLQGSAADLNKMTLVDVYAARKALGLQMTITVHDEIDGSLADPASLPALRDLLNVQRLPLRVPILWACQTGRSWAEAK